MGLIKLVVLLIFIEFCFFNTSAVADKGDVPDKMQGTLDLPVLFTNHQRLYCGMSWKKYYKDNNINIDVSVEGKYDEFVVFSCPVCGLEDSYVDIFLNTKTEDGTTNADRIKECGFVKAKFKGAKGGIGKIVRSIER